MTAFDAVAKRYESRYADAAGYRTHYIEAGEGEPVILVHGGGPGADGFGNWHSCLPGFAKRFRTIAVDMLGFGGTAKPDPASFTYSQDARTDHLIAFIEALGLGQVRLVGNSMGGITSL
ncbi:MAG: alpha/beta fold hydrolase, partial [Candidatus Binatia bacterium]